MAHRPDSTAGALVHVRAACQASTHPRHAGALGCRARGWTLAPVSFSACLLHAVTAVSLTGVLWAHVAKLRSPPRRRQPESLARCSAGGAPRRAPAPATWDSRACPQSASRSWSSAGTSLRARAGTSCGVSMLCLRHGPDRVACPALDMQTQLQTPSPTAQACGLEHAVELDGLN